MLTGGLFYAVKPLHLFTEAIPIINSSNHRDTKWTENMSWSKKNPKEE